MSNRNSWGVIERRHEMLDLCCFRYAALLRDLGVTNLQYNVAKQFGLEVGHSLSVIRRLNELACEDRESLDLLLRIRRDQEAWMLTEAFYMFAWRALERVSERTAPTTKECFGLTRREAKGIRDVRNLFLQHLEHDGFNTPNVLWSDAAPGPILKALRGDVQSKHLPVDRGLFINASEFQDVISDALAAFFVRHNSDACVLPAFTPVPADYDEIRSPRTWEKDADAE